MSTIRILPPHIANRIAAGEVVERPASVVKELLENSVDAAADSIRIELEDGGKSLIRVSDNGVGMEAEDMELAVERHATSKIRDDSDLLSIRTLGFRGEALPSIAAVSRLTITSRPPKNLEGRRVRVEFGRRKRFTAIGSPAGTTVEVEDLFLEIPARRRFLKTRRSELGHIAQTVRSMAVAHPDIHFELKSDGRTLFISRAHMNGAERLWPLIGEDLVDRMIPVEGSMQGISVSGYVAPPEEGRFSSRAFHFFLNRRPISSRLLWKAVHEAARGLMMSRSHPLGVIFLDVEPDLVDVNVHPSKQEVRFHRSDAVYRIVYHALQRAFMHQRSSAGAGGPLSATPDEGPGRKHAAHKHEQPEPDLFAPESPAEHREEDFRVSEHLPPAWDEPRGLEPAAGRGAAAGPYRIIGQLAETYIIAQGPEGMYLIDQHAAHEGLLFARLSSQMADGGSLLSQPLAFPMIIERSPGEIANLPEISGLLERIGLTVETFGPEQVAVRSVPEFLASASSVNTAVAELLDRLLADPHQDSGQVLHDIMASMACHAAIRANHHLEVAEMRALLEELESEQVSRCPHGRPVFQVFAYHEIRRRFGRT